MLKFTKLTAKDFMALGEVEYLFTPDKVRLLLGRNEDSLTADDNGAGKSSVAEALRWALYGETVRQCLDKSLSVDHVIRRGQKKAMVSVYFEAHGNEYEVKRERNTTTQKLTVQVLRGQGPWQEYSGKAAQEILDQALGINVIQFSNLVYLDGSYPLLFAPSTDRTRKDILADLVDVAITQQMEEEVRQQLLPIQTEQVRLERLIDHCTQAIEYQTEYKGRKHTQGLALTKECTLLKGASDQALQEVEALRQQVNDLRSQVEAAQLKHLDQLTKSEKELGIIDRNLETATDNLMQARSSFRVGDIDQVQKQIDSCTREIVAREKRIKEIRLLQSRGQCPTCGQATSEVGTNECNALEDQIRGFRDELQKHQAAQAVLETERNGYVDALTTTVQSLREKRVLANTALQAIRQQGAGTGTLTDEYNDLQEKFSAKQNERNELQSDLKAKRALLQQAKENYIEARKKLKQLVQDKEQAEGALAELTKQADKLSFWKTGFGPKGVPSLFIETVLPRISSRIQHFANILTGGDVMVQLRAYKETKSNTIQEAIQIDAVNSKGASVYGANSTGERNRINLAVTLGLVDYFRSTKVFASNLLICDEVFDGLDSMGVEAALEALGEAHVDHVLVVSHHEHLKPLFPEILYAHKKNGVSSLVEV